MATQPDEGEPLELTEELEVEAAAEPEEVPPEDGEEPDEDGETIIAFGDEEAEQPDDNSTIRHLREKLKEKDARLRELERSAPQKKIERRPEPTMEDCGYDEDQFKADWKAWNAEEQAATAEETKAAEANAEVQREWQSDVAAYAEKRAKLGPTVPDLDDLQQTVEGSFDLVQQAVMVKAANDPALFMVALGKNPAKLAELAKIRDPIKLASAIARMEGGIKVVTKRKAPSPDRAETGSASMSGATSMVEKQLEKLEAEAQKSRDRTKVRAFKKKHDLL